MIDQHHKITKYRDSSYPLVEVFRKADWIEVSIGVRAFGLSKDKVRTVLDKFPNLGFHKRIISLGKADFMKNPLHCMPMMKW